MQSLRTRAGFTLIEMMIVVAIIGILAAYSAPMWDRYNLKEDARSNAQNIAKAFADAREMAKTTGLNHLVIFNNPVVFSTAAGGSIQIGNIVRDNDGNFGQGPADLLIPIMAAQHTHPQVTPISATSPFGNAPLAPEDANIIDPFFPDLNAVTARAGTTFDFAPGNFQPSIGFTTQGIPVSLLTPTAPGTGAGAFYVTDNEATVYAVVLLPLGGVRVRVLNPATLGWL